MPFLYERQKDDRIFPEAKTKKCTRFEKTPQAKNRRKFVRQKLKNAWQVQNIFYVQNKIMPRIGMQPGEPISYPRLNKFFINRNFKNHLVVLPDFRRLLNKAYSFLLYLEIQKRKIREKSASFFIL